MEGEFTPEEFKSGLADEYMRTKDKARIIIETMSKKELQRMLKIFTGVFGNEIKLRDGEEQKLEHLKSAMENFMSLMQAESEIPE